MNGKIISKGFYMHPGIPNFVSAKQYVIVRSGKENQLFFRFENPKNELLSAISFTVDCYDTEGRIAKSAKIEQSGLRIKGHDFFVVNRPVVLDTAYADFKVTINSVRYGDYLYITHGEDVEVVFEKQEDNHAIDRVPFLEMLGGRTHKAVSRVIHTPAFFVVLVSLLLVSLFAVLGIKLYNFTRTETLFTLDKIEYTFASDDHENGPIVIIGTRSDAANIIIPDAIEGHDVVAVGAGAFNNSSVRTLSFLGRIEIGDYAFANSHNLQSVSIESTERIGAEAFYNCGSLKKVSIGSDLKSIGVSAFEDCGVLYDISLPDTVETIEDYAFSGCSNIRSLRIPDSTAYVGQSILRGCSALNSLSAPFIGATLSNASNLNYFFGTSSPSTLKNVTVTKMSKIHSYMFSGESYLTSVSFTTPLTEIGSYAFSGCSSLTSFDVPATVESIGTYVFNNCSSLSSISLPQNTTVITDGMFAGCESLKAISLPETLAAVGNEAFKNCYSLSELIIPGTVTHIGYDAIQNCTGLKNLVLPFLGTDKNAEPATLSSLISYSEDCSLESFTLLSGTALPNSAFYGFTKLKNVTLPEDLVTIGESCFAGCTSLTSIDLPDMLVSISERAFSSCTALGSVEIPASVAEVGAFAFEFCTTLGSIVFRGESTALGKGTLSSCTSLSYVNLPKGATLIPANTFSDCTSLEELILPSGVVKISSYAFLNCYSLKALTLPLNLVSIGNYAFSGCSALPGFTFPSTVETVGRGAFYGCSSITSIVVPETIVNMSSGVFNECLSIESMTAPFPTVFSYGANFSYYFSGRAIPASLKRITVSGVNDLTIPASAFSGCASLEELTLPDGITSIGQNAFKNCSALTSLVIPDSVEVMGSGMLTGTNALKEITLPYAALSATNEYEGFRYLYYDSYSFYTPQSLETVTLTKAVTIPEYSFQDMTTIKRINLPSTLADIGYYAFSGCSALSTITLPDQLSTIGGYAFNGCYALESLALPNTLSSIGQCAFRDCAALTSLVIPDSVEVMGTGVLIGTNALKEITLPYAALSATNEYEGFRYLYYDSYSFYTPQSLESVALTKAVAIPEYSFSGMNTIRQIELPFTLTRIGCGAFSGCSALSEITLPTSLNSIESYAFDGCSRLYSVTNLSPNLTHLNLDSIFYETIRIFSSNEEKAQNTTEQGGFSFLRAASGEWYLTGYTMGEEAVSLPTGVSLNEEIIRYAIPKFLFYNDYSLKSVNLSSDVTKICSYAFNSCSSLSEVTADPTTTFTEIGDSAFYNCYSVNKVVIPSSTTRIGDYAFACTYVSEMTLPASLTYLGNYAFYSCSSLSSVSFESGISLDIIGSYAFYGTPISSVTIPKSIRYIGDNAFAYCYSLTDVVFEDESNLYSINSYAFYNCPITSIALPASLNIIGSYAFSSCANLTEVAFAAESMLSHIYDYAFYNSGVTGIALPASLTYIGDWAFRNCYMLSRLELAEDGMLDSIGSYAFYGAPIPTLSLPDKLTNVGYCAFAYCTSLISVTIRSNFYADYSAFDGCNSIYEVYNLSGTELSVGDNSAFGRVAKNALVVHNDINAERLHDVSVNGFSFKKSGDSWFLMSVADGTDISELILDEFTYNSETVVAFVIHDNAFYGRSDISSLRIGSAVRRIGANTFSGCYNITDLSFDEDCVLEEIESYAFSGCTAVGSIILPNSLISIGDYAFYGCSSANTLLLPADLESIGSYAFQDCYKLYDVMNLSDLDVKARDESSYEYGYAGFYALAVRSSSTPMSVTTVTTDSSVARFVKHSNVWHLVDFAVTDGSGIVEFPRLAVSDTEYGYQIFDYALHTSEGFYGLNLLIYDKVSKIADLAFGYLSGNTIYYNGSRSEWNKLNKSSYAPAVYTYADCIHYDDEMYWTYDDGGVITTATTPMDIEIISESDCKVQGSAKYTCTLCEYVETRALPLSDEHDFKDGECTVCGAPSSITVTKDNFGTLEFITNDSTYPFVIDNNGVISSQNHSNSTSSTFSITATSDMTVEFQYRTSSESAYDLLYVRLNGATEKSTSGINSYMSYSVTLHVGDVLSITYSKDASVSSGDDCAYIKDLVITF